MKTIKEIVEAMTPQQRKEARNGLGAALDTGLPAANKGEKQMKFNEHRYAIRMIAEFNAKRDLAATHGGDAKHFEQLADEWKTHLQSLRK